MAATVMAIETTESSQSSSRAGRRSRKRLAVAAFAIAVVPGICIYLLTRTALFGMLIKFMGAYALLAVAIALLAILAGSAMIAVWYGFGLDNPLTKRRRYHNRGE